MVNAQKCDGAAGAGPALAQSQANAAKGSCRPVAAMP